MIFLFPRWDMLIPWRVRDLLSNNFVWNLQLLWVAGLPRNRSGEWFPAASNFHPKNKSKKTKHTHKKRTNQWKSDRKQPLHYLYPEICFILVGKCLKLRISNPLYCPQHPTRGPTIFVSQSDWSTLRLGLVTHASAVADIGDRAGKVGVDGWCVTDKQ